MARAWFGTDGIRGVANARLSPDLALRVGRALGRRLPEGGIVLIGRDTRRSGPLLEDALAAGLASAGSTALRLGVTPTPGVAWAVRERGAAAGVVISASHNPFPDNGIKIFASDGYKLPDAEEEALEALLDDDRDLPTGADIGTSGPAAPHVEEYADWLAAAAEADVSGLRIVVDCANGAATTVAPILFERLGARVEIVAAEPNGVNINVDCGSTHLDYVAERVRRGGADLGIAFDGDADRVLFVAGDGGHVDGDHILTLLARDARSRGRLPGDLVVLTSMANLGAHRALEDLGCRTVVTDVGDRYVLEAMRSHGSVLGGEQSGHVISLDRQTTGDGLLTAVLVLGALARSDVSMGEARAAVTKFPQILIGVPADRARLSDCAPIWDQVAQVEAALGRDGRVVLRASGTEPLVRVMVEAADEEACRTRAEELAETVARHIGTDPTGARGGAH
jgi:phosphoglucosamine mutase